MKPLQPSPPPVNATGTKRRIIRAVDCVAGSLEIAEFKDNESLLLHIQPQCAPVDLVSWGTSSRDFLLRKLREYGAVLLRNFTVPNIDSFHEFVSKTIGEPLRYHERSSPRHLLRSGVYSSTDYPPDQRIFFHNENSYQHNWPLILVFHCIVAPKSGGETPLSYIRTVTNTLKPELISRFRQKGVLYQRNFGDKLGLPWETVFQTNSKKEVEEYCWNAGIQLEWIGANRLRTRQVRPALVRHKYTYEELWFNHAAFFNVSSLPTGIRHALLEEFKEEELPTNTYYGDGTAIEESVLDSIRDAYERASYKFLWLPGDVLLVDNMLVAHAREPFVGSRRIVVSMAQLVEGTYGPSE